MRILILLLVAAAAFASDHLRWGAPSAGTVVEHTGYALCYNERFEQAAWVAYELTRTEAQSNKASRKGVDFADDPAIATGSATKNDYRNSGFDKGHLAPAADMKWSVSAMRESFLLSNVSPQNHDFNAGVWNDLETAVRGAATRFGAVDIVTGPVLRDGLPTIGRNRVAIPEYFYKVLYTPGDGAKAIGFVIPNARSIEPFTSYAVSVDSVEALTGLNFFDKLDDDIERSVESRADIGEWFGASGTKPTKRRK